MVHVCLSEHSEFSLKICVYRLYDFPKYNFGMLTSDIRKFDRIPKFIVPKKIAFIDGVRQFN